jgi:hypothetical protein
VTSIIRLQGSKGELTEPQAAVFRSIALIVIVLAVTTGCSVIRATPTTTAQTGTLQGVVTGPNGPVAGASVQVTPTDNSYHQAITDSQGFYQATNIPVGSVVITVSAPGYRTYSGSATIVDSQSVVQNVSLSLN